MYQDLALYIDGEFVKGGGRHEQDVINPATQEVLGKLPHASKADLDRALAAAQRAFESWKKTSPLERSKILRRVGELARERAKDIGRNITMDRASRWPRRWARCWCAPSMPTGMPRNAAASTAA